MTRQWHSHKSQQHMRRFAAAFLVTASLCALTLSTNTNTAHAATTVQQNAPTAVQSLVTTVQSNQPNSASNEAVDYAADQNPQTKWYEGSGSVPSTDSPVYAIYTLSQAAPSIGYIITSANDSQERDPKNWTVLGSNDESAVSDPQGSAWTKLDSRSDVSFASRKLSKTFTISDTTAYRYYQLRVTADKGATNKFQIADWTLVGTLSGQSANLNADDTW
ncbi:MAG: hypothetical protein ACTMHZ_07100, partial [Bifidobacterium psychraerophilum]